MLYFRHTCENYTWLWRGRRANCTGLPSNYNFFLCATSPLAVFTCKWIHCDMKWRDIVWEFRLKLWCYKMSTCANRNRTEYAETALSFNPEQSFMSPDLTLNHLKVKGHCTEFISILWTAVGLRRDRGERQRNKARGANRKLQRHIKVQPQFGSYPLDLDICFSDVRRL